MAESQTIRTYTESAERARENTLSLEQVDCLALAAQRGDRRAAERVVESVMGLILLDAWRTTRWRTILDGHRFEELLQTGAMYAYESIARWRPERGHFRTFAMSCAHFGVINEYTEGVVSTVPVTIPRDVLRVANEVKAGKGSFEEAVARDGISENTLGHALASLNTTYLSKDYECHSADGAVLHFDIEDREDDLEALNATADIEKLMKDAGFDELERWIIGERFGLSGREPKTVREIGLALGVDNERAYRLAESLRLRLRRAASEPTLGFGSTRTAPSEASVGEAA